MLAAERRQKIQDQVRKRGMVRVAELSRELGVSQMTIHRDLDRLAKEGVVEKVFGGAFAINDETSVELERAKCALCQRRIRRRTAFVVQCADGTQLRACCSHCGLMLLNMHTNAASALAVDYLYGRMINVCAATFLVDPDLTVCCTPVVLCFETRRDAERFRRGFGGVLVGLQEAQARLRQQHTMHAFSHQVSNEEESNK